MLPAKGTGNHFSFKSPASISHCLMLCVQHQPGHNSNKHGYMVVRHTSLWDTCIHCASELTQLNHNAFLEPNAGSRYLTATADTSLPFLVSSSAAV